MTGCGQGKTAGQTVSVLDVGQTVVVSVLDVGDPEAVPGEGELASEPGVVDHQPLDDRVGQHQLVHLGEKRSSQALVQETHLLQEPPVLLPDQGPAGGHEVLQLGHLGLVLLPHHCQDAVCLLLLFCQGSLQVAASVHLK